jgi:hypothetical protein
MSEGARRLLRVLRAPTHNTQQGEDGGDSPDEELKSQTTQAEPAVTLD